MVVSAVPTPEDILASRVVPDDQDAQAILAPELLSCQSTCSSGKSVRSPLRGVCAAGGSRETTVLLRRRPWNLRKADWDANPRTC